jgi:hypothetical protein
MDDITRREALLRLKRTLTKQQIEDLQIVINSKKAAGDYTGVDDDGGSFWEESISSTLASLAAELNFDNDAFDVQNEDEDDDEDDESWGSEACYEGE